MTGERAQRVGVHDHGMTHLGDELPDQVLRLGVEREARAERHRVAAGQQIEDRRAGFERDRVAGCLRQRLRHGSGCRPPRWAAATAASRSCTGRPRSGAPRGPRAPPRRSCRAIRRRRGDGRSCPCGRRGSASGNARARRLPRGGTSRCRARPRRAGCRGRSRPRARRTPRPDTAAGSACSRRRWWSGRPGPSVREARPYPSRDRTAGRARRPAARRH